MGWDGGEVRWDGVGRCGVGWDRSEARTPHHGFSDKPPNARHGDFVGGLNASGGWSSQPPFPLLTTDKQTGP